MLNSCEGCGRERRSWIANKSPIHRALVVAGSISNAQQRTIGFETTKTFSTHPENACDISINIGAKALLAFLGRDRPALALDEWRGKAENPYIQQMSSHHYLFNVLALDDKTETAIQRQGTIEKLYGIPVYLIHDGLLELREYDPDGSVVMTQIERM